MVGGLPDRPLLYPEVESLNESDAVGYAFPATPQSLRDSEGSEPWVHDLLITTGETVSALVYEESEGWKVVSKTSPGSPKEEVVNDVIAYRDYEFEDEEMVLTFVNALYDAMDELSDDG